jgi:hypothetical protein
MRSRRAMLPPLRAASIAAMRRDGLIVAGGILGVLRGAFGLFAGLSNTATLSQISQIIPGYTQIFYYELAVSLVILIVAIYALVKANDRHSAGTIRGLGIAIIVAGVVDAFWSIALLGGSPTVFGAAFGSVAALSLIGGLLAAGGTRLLKTESNDDTAPSASARP